MDNMLCARKRSLSLGSLDSENRMAKRICRQRLPQSSPDPAPENDSLDISHSLKPSVPVSTISTSSLPVPLPSHFLQSSDSSDTSCLASSSPSSGSRLSSLSPAPLSSSLTPPSSPPQAAVDSSPPTELKTPLSSESVGQLSSCSSADDVPSDKEARLAARYEDDFKRIWSGSLLIFQGTTGAYELLVRLGLWTGTRAERSQLARDFPDMRGVYLRTIDSGNLREISTHRE